jgi:Family of unknown function (DUF6941)
MTAERARIHPVAVIVCDDVRIENNGKHIVIGVFSESINVPQFPANIRVAQFLIFTTSGQGDASIDLQVRFPGASVFPTIHLEAHVAGPMKPHQMQNVALPPVVIGIAEAGEMSVFYKIEDEDWRILRSVGVALAPSPGATPAASQTVQT